MLGLCLYVRMFVLQLKAELDIPGTSHDLKTKIPLNIHERLDKNIQVQPTNFTTAATNNTNNNNMFVFSQNTRKARRKFVLCAAFLEAQWSVRCGWTRMH